MKAPPKRAFLKRGEGLSRFTNNRKASLTKKEVKKDSKTQPKARVISRSNSEPASFQRGGTNGLLRKTVILNKENRLRGSSSPPQDVRFDSKAARTKVLGSLQRRNTDGAEFIQSDTDGRQTKQYQPGQVKEQSVRKAGPSAQAARRPAQNTQPNPVTKQVGLLGELRKAENDAAREKSSRVELLEGRTGSEEEGGGGRGVEKVAPQDPFELSFQEKLQRWECNQHVESMELGEFELLEQAAEELSFSSNSSFVMKVLYLLLCLKSEIYYHIPRDQM